MSHYDIDYKGLTPAEADAKAVKDIEEYLGAERMKLMTDFATLSPQVLDTVKQLDIFFSIAGVRGLPVFAFMRTYCPTVYDEWYNSLPD